MAVQISGSSFPDEASDQLAEGFDGYGQGQYRGPSSLTPGQKVTTALDITPAETRGGLDRVAAEGSRLIHGAAENAFLPEWHDAPATHPAMKRPASAPTVPDNSHPVTTRR